MAKLKKDRLIFGLFLLVLIVIIELLLHHFHLAAWPAFLVMIFFFETHMDIKRGPHIIVGGLVGILCLVLTTLFVKAFAPMIGLMPAKLTFICVVVYAIVALGEIIPVVFNNYAFMFYLVSGLAYRIQPPAPNPWLWMGIELVAGIIIIYSILGIGKLMALIFTPSGASQPQTEH